MKELLILKGKTVLITSAADRYTMAKTISEKGAKVLIGDLIFAIGIPITIKSLRTYRGLAKLTMPLITKLPFTTLYPTGKNQDKESNDKFSKFYDEVDIIAGDFLYIKKYMPRTLLGKIIITNTVTQDDVDMLKNRGVYMLITTTPEIDGRSFGTNVMEALLICIAGKKMEDITKKEYFELLQKIKFKPRIEYLNILV